jgi:hypothetical protein
MGLEQNHRDASMPRVLHRDTPSYQHLEGRPYPLNAPTFSLDRPNLAVTDPVILSQSFELTIHA